MFGSGLKQLEKKLGHAVEVSSIMFFGGRVDLNDHFKFLPKSSFWAFLFKQWKQNLALREAWLAVVNSFIYCDHNNRLLLMIINLKDSEDWFI